MSEKIIDVWPGASLVTTRGLGRLAHYRILRHRPAINAGLDFIGPATGSATGEVPIETADVGEAAIAATGPVERVTPRN